MTNKGIKKRLLDIVDKYETQRDAAKALNSSEQYIYRITKELGIVKWRQHNRHHLRTKTETKICEGCGEFFQRKMVNKSPGRFCSKKCQGKWLGKSHGFKKGQGAKSYTGNAIPQEINISKN
jgi:formylmethanofuran dehydrogenase subunit E